MEEIVNETYRMYRRKNGIYYAENVQTKRQISLRTRDLADAKVMLVAKNESARDSRISREVGFAYLSCADPQAKTRTWRWVIDQLVGAKAGETRIRWETARHDPALRPIQEMVVVDTRAEHFLQVLQKGTVSTNVYLRRVHNFALDMGWLPHPVIVRRQWPAVKYGKKRAITFEEHHLIVQHDPNPERRDFWELLWHIGAAQGDLAKLKAEDINWQQNTLRFFRGKTGVVSNVGLGIEALAVLRRRPAQGLLFPSLARQQSKHRASEFRRRCGYLGIKGVTLHSYRYAWAQRAKQRGFPERFAMLALGHTSKAVHAAYAGTSEIAIPALDEYGAQANIIWPEFPKKGAADSTRVGASETKGISDPGGSTPEAVIVSEGCKDQAKCLQFKILH